MSKLSYRRKESCLGTIICYVTLAKPEKNRQQVPNLRENVHDLGIKDTTCQRTKRITKRYGHLPTKESEIDPWKKVMSQAHKKPLL
jgi:hypothetical protein